MGLHKTTLKSAVQKYSGFFEAGEGEAFTREQIAADERQFTPEEIDEVFAGILEGGKGDPSPGEGSNPNEGSQPPAEGEKLTPGESGPPGGSTNPPPPLAPPEQPNTSNDGDKSGDDEVQEKEFTPEDVADFVKSLTPEQAEILAKAISEIYGVKVHAEVNNDAVEAKPAEIANDYEPGVKYEAVQDFRDSRKFDLIHSVGADVTHFDPEMINNLLSRGLIKKSE